MYAPHLDRATIDRALDGTTQPDCRAPSRRIYLGTGTAARR
jgi:hypothetical protein